MADDERRQAGDQLAAARTSATETGRVNQKLRTRDALLTHSPLGRPGTVGEVGALAAFLLSDDASYITGGVHVIDGGVDVRDPMSVTTMSQGAEERER